MVHQQVPHAAKRVHKITQHGETRNDDYFWLRHREDPAVRTYVEQENDYCNAMMAHTKNLQERLYAEMRGRIKESDESVPDRYGNFEYYTRTQAGKQYKTFCRRNRLTHTEEILLDENTAAEGKAFYRVGYFEPSRDNVYVVYAEDVHGDEVHDLRILNTQTNELVDSVIPNTTYGFAWGNDNRHFYYVTLDDAKRGDKVWRHVIGSDNTQDELIHHERDILFYVLLDKTSGDDYVVIGLQAFGWSEERVLDANDARAQAQVIHTREKDLEYGVAFDRAHSRWLIVTNWHAQNFRLMESPVHQTSKDHWRELVAHRQSVLLERVVLFQNYLVRYEREGGLKRIRYSQLDLSEPHDILFPEPTFTWYANEHIQFEANVLRFTYTSLITPNTVIDYDLATQTWAPLKQQEIPSGYDTTHYETERIWAVTADGARVPISLVRKKGTPTGLLWLYAYGSYGSSVDPSFNANRLSLLDRGITFAIAHIRGGSEMGRAWYDEGKLLNKKNTFTDFVACAEHLIALGYTTQDKLAIQGKSAGGLLMGSVMTMRPDLFAAVIADVPFVDVINTMSDPTIPLTAQEWEQWGNPAYKEHYDYMKSYSPYDNIHPTSYPALLLKAGWEDPRVQYWEPAKFAAKLREMKTDNNTLLLQTNFHAGHFGSSGRFDFLREVAFDYAFVLDQFDITN